MTISGSARPIDILIVEDNPGDVRLIQEAFQDTAFQCRLSFTKDGIEALAYLHQEREYAEAVRPDLILLDLNLPRKDGRDVLNEVKKDLNLKHIPVIILTTSSDKADIQRVYGSHANCYIQKPADLNRFFEVVKILENFWLAAVQLPGRLEADTRV